MEFKRLQELVSAECKRLAKLGKPMAIAQELANRGMQGKANNSWHCPLARHLADVLMIGPLHLQVGTCTIATAHGENIVELGERPFEVVGRFVTLFDCGTYPFLEESEPEYRKEQACSNGYAKK